MIEQRAIGAACAGRNGHSGTLFQDELIATHSDGNEFVYVIDVGANEKSFPPGPKRMFDRQGHQQSPCASGLFGRNRNDLLFSARSLAPRARHNDRWKSRLRLNMEMELMEPIRTHTERASNAHRTRGQGESDRTESESWRPSFKDE
ncbi:hypothetical protein ZHAS_00005823 [Anopheles sinensis]|uniref:Uncharacterized protein n=1 Tax=Anopheles sinensis TaxID=74873 RepID=A0A084VKQ2_ANOSI|nr:hypothetical protein ZHAS_00005823 [Anopheles sinensis]